MKPEMGRMQLALVRLGLAVGLMIAADAPKEEASKKQASRESVENLQGFWTAVSVILDGKPMPKGEVSKLKMFIWPGGRYETRGMGGNDGRFKIDPAKNPKTIEMMTARRGVRGETYQGIYELN